MLNNRGDNGHAYLVLDLSGQFIWGKVYLVMFTIFSLALIYWGFTKILIKKDTEFFPYHLLVLPRYITMMGYINRFLNIKPSCFPVINFSWSPYVTLLDIWVYIQKLTCKFQFFSVCFKLGNIFLLSLCFEAVKISLKYLPFESAAESPHRTCDVAWVWRSRWAAPWKHFFFFLLKWVCFNFLPFLESVLVNYCLRKLLHPGFSFFFSYFR